MHYAERARVVRFIVTANELLDEAGDNAQQQELIAQWFEQLGDERDRKLDCYAALMIVHQRSVG